MVCVHDYFRSKFHLQSIHTNGGHPYACSEWSSAFSLGCAPHPLPPQSLTASHTPLSSSVCSCSLCSSVFPLVSSCTHFIRLHLLPTFPYPTKSPLSPDPHTLLSPPSFQFPNLRAQVCCLPWPIQTSVLMGTIGDGSHNYNGAASIPHAKIIGKCWPSKLRVNYLHQAWCQKLGYHEKLKNNQTKPLILLDLQ